MTARPQGAYKTLTVGYHDVMESPHIAAVLGVGPGLGAAVASRFARGGYTVALLARRADALRDIEAQITATGARAASFPADAADPDSIAAAFAAVRESLGDPNVLVYNAGAYIR